jgi:Putative zinc-finger
MVVNCEHVWREISNYLEGEVDPTVRAAMEAHFKECKHCTAVLDGTRNVVKLYGDDRLFELPAGFSQRLERRLAQHSSSAGYRSARFFWLLAVAAAALIVGGLTLGNSSAFKQPPDLRSHLAVPPHGIPPTLMVVVSDDGKVFHVPGCKYLHKHDDESPVVTTAADALRRGYAPCVRCLRQYLSEHVECPRPSSTPQLWVEGTAAHPELGPGF